MATPRKNRRVELARLAQEQHRDGRWRKRGSRLIASCAVNADRCRSVASDTAKGIRVQRMASTSSHAPSWTRRQDDARAIRGREWADRGQQQESRTKLEPGHGHRIVMAQVTLVERVEQRGERRGDNAHPEPQVHRVRDAADHQRDARESPGFRAEDYVARIARP